MTWLPDSRSLVVVCDDGSIHKLMMERVEVSPPIVTAWGYEAHRRWWRKNRPVEFGVGCPLSRTWSEAPEFAVGTEMACSNCRERLLLNPFAIHGEWRRVAGAWRDTDESRQQRQLQAELHAEFKALFERLGQQELSK